MDPSAGEGELTIDWGWRWIFGQEINLSVPFSTKAPSVIWAKMFTQGVMRALIYLIPGRGPLGPSSLLMEDEGPEGPSKQTNLSNLS